MGRPVFTTGELARFSGKSLAAVTQALGRLAAHGLVAKASRGLWVEVTREPADPFSLIPHILPTARAYLSFASALHLHGLTDQIPQVITLASTAHTRTKRTAFGVYAVHRIAPDFFFGFDWYKATGSFLIAAPEKAPVRRLPGTAFARVVPLWPGPSLGAENKGRPTPDRGFDPA